MKAVLWVAGTIAYYLLAVVVLFTMTLLLGDSYENIWLSAIPVTILAELILLLIYVWRKRKKKK